MALTEKGVTAFQEKETVPWELYRWLQQLQLKFPKINTYSSSIDLAAVPAATYSPQTFTVVGLNLNDIVIVTPPALTAGLYLISSRVSGTDTLSMVFYNSTGGSINEVAAVYKIATIRV